jgi:hypothetical protein
LANPDAFYEVWKWAAANSTTKAQAFLSITAQVAADLRVEARKISALLNNILM